MPVQDPAPVRLCPEWGASMTDHGGIAQCGTCYYVDV
jgi:ribosomal protein S27AE